MATPTEEAQWVLRAQCRDREALELLLRSVQPPLLRYLRGLVGASYADDVLQEVLMVIARKLPWLEDPELFRAWAFRIASRAGFRYVKRERRWQGEDALLDEIPAPDPVPKGDLLNEMLTLDSISPASRAVLALHFQEELSLPEVAAVLEIPLGTVKSRLAYGLASIRKHVAKNRSL